MVAIWCSGHSPKWPGNEDVCSQADHVTHRGLFDLTSPLDRAHDRLAVFASEITGKSVLLNMLTAAVKAVTDGHGRYCNRYLIIVTHVTIVCNGSYNL